MAAEIKDKNEYNTFDPAAWQLKQIKLPSGGEILIEYEQKDYAYVQDRSPMVMTSLTDYNESNINSKPTYTINTKDLGITTEEDLNELFIKMNDLYITKGEKIYFKFLYKIVGDGMPDLDDNLSEYIHGYAKVETIEKVGLNIKVTLTANKGSDRIEVPRQACYDFYSTQRMNKNKSDAISFEDRYQEKIERLAEDDVPSPLILLGTLPPMMVEMGPFFFQFNEYGIPDINNSGKTLNKALSFLRIPTIKAKKGVA